MISLNDFMKQTAQTVLEQLIQKLSWKIIGLIAAMFLAVFGGAAWQFHQAGEQENSVAQVRSLIFAGLQNVEELTTITTSGKATVKLQQPNEFFGFQIGTTNLVYEGVSTIQAGINLSQLQVKQADMAQHQIHIRLPAPHVMESGLDVGHSGTLFDSTDWFAPRATPEMQEQAQRKALATIQEEACANHVLEAANNNAQHIIEELLISIGFTEIQIDTQLPKDCSVN